MPRILLLGATGMLGVEASQFLNSGGYDVIKHGLFKEADVRADLTSLGSANQLLIDCKPDIIVNMTGFTSVEDCEANMRQAYLVNTKIVENMVALVSDAKSDIYFVQISTDHVYDGAGPSDEHDTTILNNYAMTKYAADLLIGGNCGVSLRTNFFGKSNVVGRESITDWVFKSKMSGASINVFDDVYFCPLSFTSVNEVLEKVIRKRPLGIFNLGSHEGMSKAQFDIFFCQCLGFETSFMKSIKSVDAKVLKAVRPKNMLMNVEKIERELGIQLPLLNDEIKKVAKQYE